MKFFVATNFFRSSEMKICGFITERLKKCLSFHLHRTFV